MATFPHHYTVTAGAGPDRPLETATSEGATLTVAPPPEFGGEAGQWSPEHLLANAVAACFVLTFKAVARASRLEWATLECKVTGELDKVDRAMQFTGFEISADLALRPGTDEAKARQILEKAEKGCLVTNSLKCPVTLTAEVRQEN